jgi:hypothetical protein
MQRIARDSISVLALIPLIFLVGLASALGQSMLEAKRIGPFHRRNTKLIREETMYRIAGKPISALLFIPLILLIALASACGENGPVSREQTATPLPPAAATTASPTATGPHPYGHSNSQGPASRSPRRDRGTQRIDRTIGCWLRRSSRVFKTIQR